MNFGMLRKMRLVNLIVCLAFCLNLGFSGSAFALRPKSAVQHVEDAVFGMGIDTLNNLNAQGPKVLEKALADLALSKTKDPLVKSLIENAIAVVKKGSKTFIVCQLGNGWYVELNGGELKKVAFASEAEQSVFMTDAQRLWLSVMGLESVTPRQISEIQIAADEYIRKAGEQGRIFAESNLAQQLEEYAKRKNLTPDAKDKLLKRLQAAIDFRKKAIESLTQEEINEFFENDSIIGDVPFSINSANIQAALSDDLAIRKAIIYDENGDIVFKLMGDPLGFEYLAVTASSGAGFAFTGYKGDLPRSIYEILGMTESYMEMVNAGDQDALKAYKAKVLLHEYAMVNSKSKAPRQENEEATNLIHRYDDKAIMNWVEREVAKVNTRILGEENKKTIAEATSANIGKFLKGGVIPAELIGVAEAELRKLVASGLLTGYRIVIKGREVSILTTRQNSKAIEDEAKVPSAILNVYLSVLNAAKEKGIYTGQDLTDKSYRKQADALEIGAPLPTLKYLQPEAWAKSTFGRIRTELTVPQGQPAAFFTTDYQGYKIDGLLAKPLEQIPDAVVNAVKAKLDRDIAEGKLLSAVVKDFAGTDIDILVTHRFGELNAVVQELVLEAMKEGVLKAKELGLLRKEIDVNSMSLAAMARALRVKYQPHSITERASEPFIIAKIIGAGIGAANIKLFHMYFVIGSTPLQKLGFVPQGRVGVRGFRAVVRRTEDVLKGNFDGPVWEFESSLAFKDASGKEYPSKNESLQLLALAGQPNDFLITAVYPVEGSTLSSTEPVVTVAYQPVYGEEGNLRTLNPTFMCRSQSGADAVGGVASMFYDVNFVPGGPDGKNYVATKPVTLKEARRAPKEGIAHVVVYGWQSELNGVIPREKGEVIDHVAINPPALQPERELAEFLAKIMITHPHDQPYLTAFAAQEAVEPVRAAQAHHWRRAPKEAETDDFMKMVEAMVASGEFVSVTDDKADMGGMLGHNFTPQYMLAIDLATVLEAIENGTLSGGNIIGFTDNGRLKRGITPAIGDDSHIIGVGDVTANSAAFHQLSFLAFTRGFLASMVGNTKEFDPTQGFKYPKKPYGRGQDFAGKEAKAAMLNPYFYSQFSERFFEILREKMPEDYKQMVEDMEKGWRLWQATKQEATLPKTFSGNVSAQGIGSARYLVDVAGGERAFGILAGDKMGPAGINRPIREGVYALLKASQEKSIAIPTWITNEAERNFFLRFIENFKNGLVFEVWDAKAYDEHENIPVDELPELFADVADAITALADTAEQNFVEQSYTSEGLLKSDLAQADKVRLAQLLKQAGYVPTKRIFLDALADKEAIYLYLADSDRFNIKQVWSKKQSGWDINNPQAYLDRPMLGSSVTKLGILAGGEYIGKDDPVMVGNIILMEHIFEFLKVNPALLQGDMNGSHWLGAIPTAAKYAVANKESHPILVGFRYTLSDDGKTLAQVEDVFGKKDYARIRNKMFKFNFEFKKAQLGGQFEPYGTNWRTVEASYPLARLLRAIQDIKSFFLVRNKPQAERSSRPIGTFGDMVDLFNIATGSLAMPSASEGWTGADEWAGRFQKSLLSLQSSGIANKLSEEALSASTDLAHKKVVLINAKVLESDPSLILALQSANQQINQRLGIFESNSNSAANAYKFVLVTDDPALKTAQDVEKLFAAVAKATDNGARVNKDMFAEILTQGDMYEGTISDAAALLKQLKRMGVSEETLVGFVGSKEWTDSLKSQAGISKDAVSGNVDAKNNQAAFAANALFGVVEAVATADRKVPDSLAKKLELIQEATSIHVVSKEITPTVADEIESYRKQVEAAIGV